MGAVSERGGVTVTRLRMGVVGGSIAGCAMAVAGARAGAEVTVYERSDGELRSRGLGIVIPPALHRELTGVGYLDAAMPTAPLSTRVWVTRASGSRSAREFARQPGPVTACNWGLLWQALRQSSGSSPGVRYHRGRPVLSVERTEAGRALVRTASGAQEYDVVVGADGHRSLTRRLLAPDLRPSPAGYAVWRGTLPLSALMRPPAPAGTAAGVLGHPRVQGRARDLLSDPARGRRGRRGRRPAAGVRDLREAARRRLSRTRRTYGRSPMSTSPRSGPRSWPGARTPR